MVELKPRTKVELEKMLSIALEIEKTKVQYNEITEKIESLYETDQEKYNEFIEQRDIYENMSEMLKTKLKNNEISESEYHKQKNNLTIPRCSYRYISKANEPLELDYRKQRKQIVDKQKQLLKELNEQHKILMQIFIDEYGLSDKHAEVVEKTKKDYKKLYHNPGHRRIQRDIREVCFNIANGEFIPGNIEHNATGVGLFFGDKAHTQWYYSTLKRNCIEAEDFETQPQLIEVAVKPEAKIRVIDITEYLRHPGEEYRQFFNPEDYELLNAVQTKTDVHLRCIFDVALGYDACVRVDTRDGCNNNEVWAVYNRSILEMERNPIKEFNNVVEEVEKTDEE